MQGEMEGEQYEGGGGSGGHRTRVFVCVRERCCVFPVRRFKYIYTSDLTEILFFLQSEVYFQ